MLSNNLALKSQYWRPCGRLGTILITPRPPTTLWRSHQFNTKSRGDLVGRIGGRCLARTPLRARRRRIQYPCLHMDTFLG
jgi:hypothetical protein